jgi:hypothetical protein
MALGSAVAVALACAPVDRARQCERLAETVNPALAQIEAETTALNEAKGKEQLEAIADAYEKLAERVEALEVLESMDGKLKPITRDMRRLFARTSKTTRNIAKHFAANKVAPLRNASRQLERQTREQESLLKRAKRICKTTK